MSAWNFDPSVVAFVAAVALFYAVGLVRDAKERGAPVDDTTSRAAFASIGILALVVALISPLDALADRALFVAHMAQHLLLLLVVPTFLIAGAPSIAVEMGRTAARTGIGRLVLSQPVLLLVSVGTLWAWHAPRLFDAALQDNLLHAFEHAAFLGTSLLFWWPALRPGDFPWRPPDLARLAYLFASAVASSLLAALITFSADPLYLEGSPTLGRGLTLATSGLSPIEDQQLGGILMWGFGSLWYFAVAGVIFVRWFERSREMDDVASGPVVDGSEGSL